MIISSIPYESFKNFHKGIQRNYIKFDNYRFCEFENIVHIWKTLKSSEKISIIEDFKHCFSNCFEFENVFYDNLKFNIFKVVMKAIKTGIIFKNKFINVNIEVVDKSKYISNEIQSLGILSIQQIKQLTQVRINDEIWFYFTDFQ